MCHKMRMEGDHSNVSLHNSSNLICVFQLLLSFWFVKFQIEIVWAYSHWRDCFEWSKVVFKFHQMIPHSFRSIKGKNGCLSVVSGFFVWFGCFWFCFWFGLFFCWLVFFSGISFTVKSLWQKSEIWQRN